MSIKFECGRKIISAMDSGQECVINGHPHASHVQSWLIMVPYDVINICLSQAVIRTFNIDVPVYHHLVFLVKSSNNGTCYMFYTNKIRRVLPKVTCLFQIAEDE